jgi:hypothetical protein
MTSVVRDAEARPPNPPATPQQTRIGALRQNVAQLTDEICPAILIHCNPVDIGERDSGLRQAVCDCLRRKPCPVLDATKALLLGSCYERTIANERRR